MGLVCVLGIVMFVRPIMLYPAGLRPCRAIFMPFSLQMLPIGLLFNISSVECVIIPRQEVMR